MLWWTASTELRICNPVVARFGHSSLTAQGIVDTTPGKPGKIITLDVRSQESRLEDMLRVAVKGKPALQWNGSFSHQDSSCRCAGWGRQSGVAAGRDVRCRVPRDSQITDRKKWTS